MHPTITINIQPLQYSTAPRQQSNSLNQTQYQSPLLKAHQNGPQQQYPKPTSQQNPSKCIKNYVIDYNRKIGEGNFSNVYVAMDQKQPNIKLAVKVVNAQSLRQQNLEILIKSEVQVLMAMKHQNIIYCKDVFWDEKYCYIFTQFCEGGSLEAKIKKSQTSYVQPLSQYPVPQCEQNSFDSLQSMYSNSTNSTQISLISLSYPNFGQKQMLPIIKDIFQAMLYLEKCHIIHRDIKAANIFIKDNRAIVADFGFARYVAEPFVDLNIGSLPWMPPEALSKNLYSNKTDVWAFGVLLYEIFHGDSPYAKCHDMKQIIQKAYIPLGVTSIRNDLSVEMKELILNCLEVDFQKRKKFSEIQKMWYCKKLFQNINAYGYGYRVDRLKVPAGDKMQNIQGGSDSKLSNSKMVSNGRSFGSRFKEKVSIGNSAKNMNYSDNSNSESKSKEKQKQRIKNQQMLVNQNVNMNPNINVNTNQNQYPNPNPNPNPNLNPNPNTNTNMNQNMNQFMSQNNEYQLSSGGRNLNGSQSIQSHKRRYQVDTVLTPTGANKNIASRIIISPINFSSTPPPLPSQTQSNQQQYIPPPTIRKAQSTKVESTNTENMKTENIKQQFKPNIQPKVQQKQKESLTQSFQGQKISFKDILLRIQEIRNYYKLAVMLKDRNKKITQIKNRLFIKSLKQMTKIQKMIEKDQIDLSVYDKNKHPPLPNLSLPSKLNPNTDGNGMQKQQRTQNNQNILNRKAKLSSIIKDYKVQFQNQLKRRQIIATQNDNMSSNYSYNKIPQFLISPNSTPLNKQLKQPTSADGQSSNSTPNNSNNTCVLNFKGKTPSLSQDIEYIVQTQLMYHYEDTLGMSYEEYQGYRGRIKQILQDIMHLQHGYLSIEDHSKKNVNVVNKSMSNNPLQQQVQWQEWRRERRERREL